MKEMIYSAKRLNPPEMLADGEYKGFHFFVLSFGIHPCAYIDVTETDLKGKDYTKFFEGHSFIISFDVDLKKEKIKNIECGL